MSNKRQRRARTRNAAQKQLPREDESPPQEERFIPKAGPGQVFKPEMIDAKSGHALHLRNIGHSPLELAFYRGQLATNAEKKDPAGVKIIARERFDAGEAFAKWWAMRESSMRDSTIPAISGGNVEFWTEAKAHASRQLNWLIDVRNPAHMAARNYLIISAFCGMGFTMAQALRRAGVETKPDATAYRIREALDDLVCASTGRAWLRESSREETARESRAQGDARESRKAKPN